MCFYASTKYFSFFICKKKADLRKYGLQIGAKYGLIQAKRTRRKSILNTVIKMKKHGMDVKSIAEIKISLKNRLD
ncbi:MAG: hypothetical protein H7A23_21315 [Leptospiraceae bacterium]|nr:hypothetical protein [Leptospiraceae bacterium]